jgi:SAM-dependent methyltransferase
MSDRYEMIGRGYAVTRREDPRIARRIHEALGDASSVVSVGAGTGSYEPDDRYVIAVEPSNVMAAQRPPHRVPAIRAAADDLPLRDRSVDAAMAILTLHHWEAAQEQGVRELRRVARDRVVLLTYDARVSASMWLVAEYLPEIAELDARSFPPPETLIAWLGGEVRVDPVPLHRDTSDWMLGSFWAHPERALDERARANTSGFARMRPDVLQRAVTALRRDLDDGSWDARHGELRTLDECDVGLRLVVARRH